MNPYRNVNHPMPAPPPASCISEQACAPESSREIARLIDDLRQSIGAIEHGAEMLEKRMEPVLAPQSPEASGNVATPPVMSPMGQALEEFNNRARGLARRLQLLNERTLL